MNLPAAQQVCAYCGNMTSTAESDHVPPRTLFAAPRPSSLITVPACSACHRPTSKDDEYFRLVLSLRNDTANAPDVVGGVLDSALRSLARPKARGYAKRFLQTVKEVDVHSPAGIYLGRAGTYVADFEPVFRVVERVVRGLFFHHAREPLGSDYLVRVFEDSFLDWDSLAADQIEFLRSLATQLHGQTPIVIGSAFNYSFRMMPEDVRVSAWRMVFYGSVVFVAMTGPVVGETAAPARTLS